MKAQRQLLAIVDNHGRIHNWPANSPAALLARGDGAVLAGYAAGLP